MTAIMLAMALGERDGLWLVGGLLLALVSTILVAAIVLGGTAGMLSIIS